MHLSLGGIVKGITTGLETLAETGNPFIAAGAGAVACLTDNGSTGVGTGPQIPTFSPLLDQLSAENPALQQNVNSLSTFAQQHANDLADLLDPQAAAA
ncbi:MAG TPA: hypothetical protein VFN37_03580 [Candidatus Baltobacteraceae bacterium]|nr:hypothetical protein [Candidatus Baltobacteraceae bacterium]